MHVLMDRPFAKPSAQPFAKNFAKTFAKGPTSRRRYRTAAARRQHATIRGVDERQDEHHDVRHDQILLVVLTTNGYETIYAKINTDNK